MIYQVFSIKHVNSNSALPRSLYRGFAHTGIGHRSRVRHLRHGTRQLRGRVAIVWPLMYALRDDLACEFLNHAGARLRMLISNETSLV